jgi:hypothetical protein
VRLVTLDEGDAIVDVARVVPDEDEKDSHAGEIASEGASVAVDGSDGSVGE